MKCPCDLLKKVVSAHFLMCGCKYKTRMHPSRMRTVRRLTISGRGGSAFWEGLPSEWGVCLLNGEGGLPSEGGLRSEGGLLSHDIAWRQNSLWTAKHVWKHNLAATSFAGGNYLVLLKWSHRGKLRCPTIGIIPATWQPDLDQYAAMKTACIITRSHT